MELCWACGSLGLSSGHAAVRPSQRAVLSLPSLAAINSGFILSMASFMA
jgi:hypothetical protein